MKNKLLFIINDSSAQYIQEMAGVKAAIGRRAVEIELTAEQEAAIGLKAIGKDNGRIIFEVIESISPVQDYSDKTQPK